MQILIAGLDPEPFRPLFTLDDATLAARGIERQRVESTPGVPDRISLRDLLPGETALLINHCHQPHDTPYRASHAIYVGETAGERACYIDQLPPALAIRPLSLRAFSPSHRMVDAALAEGDAALDVMHRLLQRREVAYLQAHYARPGCYAARVSRG